MPNRSSPRGGRSARLIPAACLAAAIAAVLVIAFGQLDAAASLSRIAVKDGAYVHKGELLGALDNTTVTLTLAAARATSAAVTDSQAVTEDVSDTLSPTTPTTPATTPTPPATTPTTTTTTPPARSARSPARRST